MISQGGAFNGITYCSVHCLQRYPYIEETRRLTKPWRVLHHFIIGLCSFFYFFFSSSFSSPQLNFLPCPPLLHTSECGVRVFALGQFAGCSRPLLGLLHPEEYSLESCPDCRVAVRVPKRLLSSPRLNKTLSCDSY